MGPGIDYGMGRTNRDPDTGIHYGVIPENDVGQAWFDSAEPNYGEPTCPKCGNEGLVERGDDAAPEYVGVRQGDYWCPTCDRWSDSERCFSESPISFTYEGEGYACEQSGDDSDIFIVKSPYYTLASYCSPCAPGAGHLRNPTKDGVETYCFVSRVLRCDGCASRTFVALIQVFPARALAYQSFCGRF
jgi:hypothetical protein